MERQVGVAEEVDERDSKSTAASIAPGMSAGGKHVHPGRKQGSGDPSRCPISSVHPRAPDRAQNFTEFFVELCTINCAQFCAQAPSKSGTIGRI